ncbi:MAG: hypothetical protein EKK35_06345 [Bradyrhizobiaceae bacterium]|nr:MAG: hypothetical protein EKK35_06345 [Bradyrhizobiaceae bacterium]
MSTKPILCSKCETQVNIVPDPKPQDLVTCPVCGDSDTFENVKRSLGEQATEWAQKKLRATFSGSKAWKYTEGVTLKRNHRFVVNLD